MKTKLPFTIIFIFFGLNIFAQTREVPFTLEDRDRIILIEEKLNSQQMQINDIKKEIGNLRAEIGNLRGEIGNLSGEIRGEIGNLRAEIKVEIDGLRTQYYWGFGILIAILLFLLGYIIWDRRTAIAPLREEVYLLREKSNNIEKVLKEFSKKQPAFAEILKSYGLL